MSRARDKDEPSAWRGLAGFPPRTTECRGMAACAHGLTRPQIGLLLVQQLCPQHQPTCWRYFPYPHLCILNFLRTRCRWVMESHSLKPPADAPEHPSTKTLSFPDGISHVLLCKSCWWPHQTLLSILLGTPASATLSALSPRPKFSPPVPGTTAICCWAPLRLWPPPLQYR